MQWPIKVCGSRNSNFKVNNSVNGNVEAASIEHVCRRESSGQVGTQVPELLVHRMHKVQQNCHFSPRAFKSAMPQRGRRRRDLRWVKDGAPVKESREPFADVNQNGTFRRGQRIENKRGARPGEFSQRDVAKPYFRDKGAVDFEMKHCVHCSVAMF